MHPRFSSPLNCIRRSPRITIFIISLAVGFFTPRATADALPRAISKIGELVEHTFRFMPKPGENPRHVNLAGDFNGWSIDATPMVWDGHSFVAVVKVMPDVHHYKFIVDGRWIPDPAADKSLDQDDGNGGLNSGVQTGFDIGHLGKTPGIRVDAVAFDPNDEEDCNVVSSDQFRISFRAGTGNLASAAILFQTGATDWKTFPLNKAETSGNLERFGGFIEATQADVRYVLELTDATETAYVADGMAYATARSAEAHAYRLQLTPTFRTPDWAKHAVWYQIFPERFRNGDTANDPPHTLRWTSRWYGRQPGESGDFSRDVFERRYGGDLQGIKQELPYLRSLGVNAIYLNPLFEAESLHKYDTTDYRHVDEHLGDVGEGTPLYGETDDPATWKWSRSDRIFLDLIAEAHRQGFRVVIDGVFNHTGTQFWAFQDVVKHGRESRFAKWFDIIDWEPGVDRRGRPVPFHYRAWDGENGSLPAFKKDSVLGLAHGPREHILAIAQRWLAPDGDPSAGVDGFRLDAAENVPHPFWVEFRSTVKSIKPDAYIDGEIWNWAQQWLGGDQFDAVMNYQFAIASHRYFVSESSGQPDAQYNNDLNALVYRYPFQVALVNQNLLDSHDTDRVASMFANPGSEFGGGGSKTQYNTRKPTSLERLQMLQEVAMQMTFVGAPMIYYGDEAGMWGGTDPSDRQPMLWNDLGPSDDPEVSIDHGKWEWYQRLIALRQQLPALQTGFYRTLPIDGAAGVLGFIRTLPGQAVYVLLNHTDQARQVTFSPNLPDGSSSAQYVNWIGLGAATLSSADSANLLDRPRLVLDQGAHVLPSNKGKISLRIAPWGVAVLAPR